MKPIMACSFTAFWGTNFISYYERRIGHFANLELSVGCAMSIRRGLTLDMT